MSLRNGGHDSTLCAAQEFGVEASSTPPWEYVPSLLGMAFSFAGLWNNGESSLSWRQILRQSIHLSSQVSVMVRNLDWSVAIDPRESEFAARKDPNGGAAMLRRE
jgi:hypothetical protein